MFELEKRGIPTVSWTAERFVNDAAVSARAFGLPAIALAVIPVPATNQPDDSIKKMAGDSIARVVDGLTKPIMPKMDEVKAQPSEVLQFPGGDLLEASEAMNRAFLKEGWSDGLPLVPQPRPPSRAC